MPREDTPKKKVKIRRKLNDFAKKHGLKINKSMDFKLEWMEEHGGLCFCQPDGSRICPCQYCLNDIQRVYSGHCLCSLFMTKELYEKLNKPKKEDIREKIYIDN